MIARYWLIAIGMAAVLGLGPAWSAASMAAAPAYIEISADAEARAKPDHVVVEFGVVTRADSAAAAAQQNADRMQAVLAAVRPVAGEKANIGTGAYSLRAEYSSNRDSGPAKVTGYVASNILRLETADLARIGEIVDVGIKAGANQVQRIAFGLRDPSAARRSALRDAVLQARADAETIAATLKVRIGGVLSVTNQDAGPVRPYVQEAMASRTAAPATPIEPRQITVRVRVTVRLRVES